MKRHYKKPIAYLLVISMFICSGVLYTNAAETTGLENESIFNIKNVNSGLMLDLYNSNDANGTNVQQYTADGTNAQKWKIIYNSTSDCYYIKSVRSLNKGNSRQLDVYCTSSDPVASGHNVQIWAPGDDPSSTWSIVHISNGQYKIVLKQYPTLALTVSGSSTASGANVLIQTYSGSASQKWTFVELDTPSETEGITSGMTYCIRSRKSEMNLAATPDGYTSGNNVVQQTKDNLSRNQRWDIFYLYNGYYVIRPSGNSTAALGVANNYLSNSSNIQIVGTSSGNTSSLPDRVQWRIVKNVGGSSTGYRLIPKSSLGTQALNVVDGSLTTGANVIQYPYYGTQNDQWYFESVTIQLEAQQQTQWCWAASARMLAKASGTPSRSQASVAVRIISGIDTLNPTSAQISAANQPASPNQCEVAAELLTGYECYSETQMRIFTEYALQTLLVDDFPVIVFRGWYNESGRNGGHATVVYDYYYDSTTGVYWYKIFDPWDVNTGTMYDRTYASLCNGRVGRNTQGDIVDDGIWESIIVYERGNYAPTIAWPLA